MTDPQDFGFALNTLVEAARGMTDAEARDFLVTGVPYWQRVNTAPAVVGDRQGLTDEQIDGILTSALLPGDPHTGAMVALVPRSEDAARLAVDGGEDVEQLHLTLAFLGEAADVPDEARGEVIERALAHFVDQLPITGTGFAVAEFNPLGSDPCCVLIVGDDTGRLEAEQHFVCDFIVTIPGWMPPDQRSPWVPHITLMYVDPADIDVKELSFLTGPVIFDRVRVAFGGEVVDVPLMSSLVAAETFHLQHQQKDHGRRYTAGADLLSDLTKLAHSAVAYRDAHRRDYEDPNDPYGPRPDLLLHGIAVEQHFDGEPKVVSAAELDELIASGQPELWRGVKARESGRTAADINEELRNGPVYYGAGIYGNGVYTALRENHAHAFSDGTTGAVSRMTLRPDARVGDYEEIRREWSSYANGIQDPTVYDFMGDPGRYAAARGWDAYVTPEQSIVVLNRTALVIEEAKT